MLDYTIQIAYDLVIVYVVFLLKENFHSN